MMASAAFLASISLMVVMILAGFKPYIVVLASLLLFSAMVFGPSSPLVFYEALNSSFITTLGSLAAAMYLAELFRENIHSREAVESLESVDPRLAGASIPALVGLLPMPGGAYVSATLVDSVYRKTNMKPEEKTFLNFWFRHIWITVWPLYQGVLIASYITGMDVRDIAWMNIPIMLASFLAGLPFLFSFIAGRYENKRRSLPKLVHLWPFGLIALLNLGLNLNVFVSVIATIAVYSIVYKPSLRSHLNALKYSLNPSILTLIAVSLIYGHVISVSGLASQLGTFLRPVEASLFAVTTLVVIATGFEFTFSAIVFPVFKPFLNPSNMFYGFLGGFTGSMLSPVHACLVLSADYFKADLKKVYKYLAPATITTIATSLILRRLV